MWDQTKYDVKTFCPACKKEFTAKITKETRDFVVTHCPHCGISQMFFIKRIRTTQVVRDSEPELAFSDKEA